MSLLLRFKENSNCFQDREYRMGGGEGYMSAYNIIGVIHTKQTIRLLIGKVRSQNMGNKGFGTLKVI